MKQLFLACLLAATTGGAAQAQSVNDCNWVASARNLVEPWGENARTFSNGKTRIALLDTVEPAAAAFHLLVLSPPYNELGDRQCRVVSASPGYGFAGIRFDGLQASYDPSVGLMFQLPVEIFNLDTGLPDRRTLYFTLNQATGVISFE